MAKSEKEQFGILICLAWDEEDGYSLHLNMKDLRRYERKKRKTSEKLQRSYSPYLAWLSKKDYLSVLEKINEDNLGVKRRGCLPPKISDLPELMTGLVTVNKLSTK